MSFNHEISTLSQSVEARGSKPLANPINDRSYSAGSLFGRKIRCSHPECKKKLSLTEQSILCICKKSFCLRHRGLNSHNCEKSEEYRELKKERLRMSFEPKKSSSSFSQPVSRDAVH